MHLTDADRVLEAFALHRARADRSIWRVARERRVRRAVRRSSAERTAQSPDPGRLPVRATCRVCGRPRIPPLRRRPRSPTARLAAEPTPRRVAGQEAGQSVAGLARAGSVLGALGAARAIAVVAGAALGRLHLEHQALDARRRARRHRRRAAWLGSCEHASARHGSAPRRRDRPAPRPCPPHRSSLRGRSWVWRTASGSSRSCRPP